MRRPRPTAAQRRFAREQSALLALRKAAVRYSDIVQDFLTPRDGAVVGALNHLTDAAQHYSEVLGARDRRALMRVRR